MPKPTIPPRPEVPERLSDPALHEDEVPLETSLRPLSLADSVAVVA